VDDYEREQQLALRQDKYKADEVDEEIKE